MNKTQFVKRSALALPRCCSFKQ